MTKAELKADIAEVKADIVVLKTDVAGLKTDVTELKTDVAGLKIDMATMRAELDQKIDSSTRRLAFEIVKTNERIDALGVELRQEMRALKSEVTTALDASVRRMETFWRESVMVPRVLDAHGATLEEHHRRLLKLESAGR